MAREGRPGSWRAAEQYVQLDGQRDPAATDISEAARATGFSVHELGERF
jgi:hypothetical protein